MMQERARKERKSYLEFYKDYGFFFKEGIITSHEQYEKEEISKLLRLGQSDQIQPNSTRINGQIWSLC